MVRKTFISYKYSEAKKLRDDIIDALGESATFYKGETSTSPDLTDFKTSLIKEKLKDMMYDTSVTVVVISPNMLASKWIDWELEYCLKHISRKGRTSRNNGIVGVIQKVNGSYDWLINHGVNCHGTQTISYDFGKIFPIIAKNVFNSYPKLWHCSNCETYDYHRGGYITLVKEEEFLSNVEKYIEIAYEKSGNDASGYNLQITNFV